MERTDWDERYAGSELLWSSEPNVWVEQITADLPPGNVIDAPSTSSLPSTFMSPKASAG